MHRLAQTLALLLMAGGCGGAEGMFTQYAKVTDVRVDPEEVRIGEEIVIQVDFIPSEDETVDSDGDSSTDRHDTSVVLRIPIGIDYVTGSSVFDGSDVHGFRERGPNMVEICADGTRALSYHFASGELTDNENKIRLSAVAYEANGTLRFEGEANRFISSPCSIGADDFDTITVYP